MSDQIATRALEADQTTAAAIARESLAMRSAHPQLPALEILDVVMKDRHGIAVDADGEDPAWSPYSGFWALLRDAFDHRMPEHLREAVADPATDYNDGTGETLELWDAAALTRFFNHYSLNGHKPGIGPHEDGYWEQQRQAFSEVRQRAADIADQFVVELTCDGATTAELAAGTKAANEILRMVNVSPMVIQDSAREVAGWPYGLPEDLRSLINDDARMDIALNAMTWRRARDAAKAACCETWPATRSRNLKLTVRCKQST